MKLSSYRKIRKRRLANNTPYPMEPSASDRGTRAAGLKQSRFGRSRGAPPAGPAEQKKRLEQPLIAPQPRWKQLQLALKP